MNEKIKSAIDKLFEDAKNGDEKAGTMLCKIFNETLQATTRCQQLPPINNFEHEKYKRRTL